MHALFLALQIAGTTLAPGASAPAFPYPLHEAQLDNGLRVVVVERPGTGMFALYSVVGTGSRDEVEKGKSGFAHFFEHMMFRGTDRFPGDKRTALLGSLGVDESGYTTDDFTAYHLTGPSEALPSILELEGDRYQNLKYSEEAFKIESRAVLGEYNKSQSNPDNKAWEELAALAFDTHTYKHTTIGFLADIEAMPKGYAYAQGFFKRFYVPNNVMLIVVGDVQKDAVFAGVKQHFGAWQGARADTTLADEPALTKERVKAVAWDQPTLERVLVGWRVPSGVRTPRAAALGMLLARYAFSESSALYKKVVLDEQLAEAVDVWFEPHKDAALFPVLARVREGKASADVLARLQSGLDEIAGGGVDATRFEAVKSNLRYSLLMSLVSPDSIAGTLASTAGPSMDVHALDKMLADVDALTAADLVAFTKAHFGAQQRAVVTLKYTPGAKPTPVSAKKGGAQ